MSRPRLATLLLLAVAVTGTADRGVAAATSHQHHPPLLDCGPASILSKNADATFRGDLAAALAAVPSGAAARRDAFTSQHIGSAFARGACFAANVSTSPAVARACEACLSAAARDATGVCRSSGRAGVWRDECFLTYADSNASTAREDAFRGWFYAGPSTNVVPDGGACVADRAVDCGRCWDESARAAAALGWWQRVHGEEVLVVGYSCFLRVRISTLPKGPEVATVRLGIMFIRIVEIVRALPQVNVNAG